MKKSTRTRSKTVRDTQVRYQTGMRSTPVRRASMAGKTRDAQIDISIPGPVFQAMQQLAGKLNVSLSELYTAALTTYVADHGGAGVTEALDRLYATESSELDAVLVSVQAALFAGIAKDERQAAQLVPLATVGYRQYGSAQGLVTMANDFDAPLADFADYST